MKTSVIKGIKPVIKIAPVFLLIMDLLSLLMYSSKSHLWAYYHTFIQEQFFGHSFLLLLICLYFSIRLKQCLYTVISLIGLMTLNVYNSLLYFSLKYDELNQAYYYPNSVTVYKYIIIIVFLCLSIVFLIKRK